MRTMTAAELLMMTLWGWIDGTEGITSRRVTRVSTSLHSSCNDAGGLEKNGGRADVHRRRGRRCVCLFTEIIVASYLN